MKDIINYYYGIQCVHYEIINGNYFFNLDDNNFVLMLINDENSILNIIDVLNSYNAIYDILYMTKEGKSYIEYNGFKYMLFKRVNIDIDNNIYSKCIVNNYNFKWSDVWSLRVDNYESELYNVVKDNDILYSMNYYIGLTECLIRMYNDIELSYGNLFKYSIGHKRLNLENSNLFYNPANMCIDLWVRDIAEYIKFSFFEDTLTCNKIIKIVNDYSFDDISANLFLIRLMYPNYYFDLFDDYIVSGKIDNKMIFYNKKSNDYESLLNNIYNILSLKYKLIINCYIFKSRH